MDAVLEFTKWLLLALAAIAMVYALARGISVAYFRSRLEHFRMLRKLKKED